MASIDELSALISGNIESAKEFSATVGTSKSQAEELKNQLHVMGAESVAGVVGTCISELESGIA
ncbi:MAG: hypothetical protein ACRDXX_17735, partial [Stackebrandtia sp.]